VPAHRWRGSEQMGVSAQQSKIHLAIAVWQCSLLSPEALQKGIRMTFAKWRRPSPETAPTAKQGSWVYMICTLFETCGLRPKAMPMRYARLARADREATGAMSFLGIAASCTRPSPIAFRRHHTRTVIDLAASRHQGDRTRHHAGGTDQGGRGFIVGTAAEVTPSVIIGPIISSVGPLARQLVADYARWCAQEPAA